MEAIARNEFANGVRQKVLEKGHLRSKEQAKHIGTRVQKKKDTSNAGKMRKNYPGKSHLKISRKKNYLQYLSL